MKNKLKYIILPEFLTSDSSLNRTALILGGFIYSLFNAGNKIFASNAYLMNLCEVSLRSIQDGLSCLEKKGYIKRESVDGQRIITWTLGEMGCVPLHGVVQDFAPPPCRDLHTYNKDYNKVYKTSLESKKFEQLIPETTTQESIPDPDFRKDQSIERCRSKALRDPECILMYEEKFKNCDITLDGLFEDAIVFWRTTYYSEINIERFRAHLKNKQTKEFPQKPQKTDVTTESKGFGTQKSDIVHYNKFILDVGAMARFKEIPFGTSIPSYDEWLVSDYRYDSSIFRRHASNALA